MEVKFGWCIMQVHLLITAASSSSIVPSYVWPLAFIYNKTIPVNPPLKVYGNVTKATMGLFLDGEQSWIDAGDFTGNCISETHLCSNGLSLAVRIKFDASIDGFVLQTQPKFIFDSGGYTGEGVSLYTQNGEIVGVVEAHRKVWTLSSPVVSQRWQFILLTWSESAGLFMYIDGPRKSQSLQPTPIQQSITRSNHVTIGRCNVESTETFGRFFIDMVATFESFSPNGQVYLSYAYSPPSTKGNVRYVNARFINTANYNLIIFPDRGKHQEKGYQLEADSSTLLEYVLREGPIPSGMDFRIKNKANGELLKHDDNDILHIASSDDMQVVTELTILPGGVISKVVSSLGVNPNYQVAKSTEQELEPIEITQAVSNPKVPAKTDAQTIALTNPEIPIEEESNTGTKINKTASNSTPAPTIRIPTIPPPPILPPVGNKSGNATQQNKNESSIKVTSPELPTEEGQIAGVSVDAGNNTKVNIGGKLKETANTIQSGDTNKTQVGTGNITQSSGVNGTQLGKENTSKVVGVNIPQKGTGNTTEVVGTNEMQLAKGNTTQTNTSVPLFDIKKTSTAQNNTTNNVTAAVAIASNQTLNGTKEQQGKAEIILGNQPNENLPNPIAQSNDASQKDPNSWTQPQIIPEHYNWNRVEKVGQQGAPVIPFQQYSNQPGAWGQGQFTPQEGTWNQAQYTPSQSGVKQEQRSDNKLNKEYVDNHIKYTPVQPRSDIVNNQRLWTTEQ